MKAASPWITYRTRFLVKARQLSSSLTFTDVLGRLHSGRKGDYLVESSDGVLRIAPRQIFEDIYVPLLADRTLWDQSLSDQTQPAQPAMDTQPQILPAPMLPPSRKRPQPYRDRSSPNAGLRSL
jgi:hypothetical protein